MSSMQPPPPPPPSAVGNGPRDQSFDMSKLSAAMPQLDSSASYYQQPPQFIQGLGIAPPMYHSPYDPQRTNVVANAQRPMMSDMKWRQDVPGQSPTLGGGIAGHAWGTFPPHDARMMLPGFAMQPAPRNSEHPRPREVRRRSIPSSLRGPPRKPKRSGFALWVGNLPPSAQIEELKDHFSAGATQDIDSVFLISKSNCAFVNYQSEGASIAAMNRFHNSRFRGRALVCRFRKTTSSTSPPPPSPSTASALPPSASSAPSPGVVEEPASPLIVGRNDSLQDGIRDSPTRQPDDGRLKIPEKYFILKSLTLEDLESSLATRSWATQPHNEDTLNKAYEESNNVYLVFSANKSGEYFGYARMMSPVSAKPVDMRHDSGKEMPDDVDADSPRTILTPPTSTAPKGRIIDDSARGSIFWEADHSTDAEESVYTDAAVDDNGNGGQFTIEWQSTTRIPFYQTRGMRNSFNGNREIKIARDGQELDPRVGRRLLQLFRASPGSGFVDGVH